MQDLQRLNSPLIIDNDNNLYESGGSGCGGGGGGIDFLASSRAAAGDSSARTVVGPRSDWRRGREAEFVRLVYLLIPFPHWGIAEEESAGVMQRAMDEAEAIMRQSLVGGSRLQ
jgi:hypothetical protein